MKSLPFPLPKTVPSQSRPERLPLGALPPNAKDLVIAVIESLPKGYVATYAQVAYRAGLTRRRARFVGKVLRDLPENSQTPWHRVVSSSRVLADRSGKGRQATRLRREGIVFEKNLIPRIFFKWPEL
jgi:methylated-DNA-protein-cysteine methyltransferase-like protein